MIIKIGSFEIRIERSDKKQDSPFFSSDGGSTPIRVLTSQQKEEYRNEHARQIVKLAYQYGWTVLWHKADHGVIRFKKNKNDFCDVWYGTMTVGTIINHPVKGRRTLYRKNQSMRELAEILNNPRVHTGEGYYKKRP